MSDWCHLPRSRKQQPLGFSPDTVQIDKMLRESLLTAADVLRQDRSDNLLRDFFRKVGISVDEDQ